MLSWHKKLWQMLWDAAQKNRLPHGLLFSGFCEFEKKHFTQFLASTLLCSKPSIKGPCENCHACHLVKAQSHPDLLWVEPETGGQVIKIDQIREIVANASETAMQNGWRIIIIHPAHAMNIAACNALLKTLEEPPAHVLIILMTDQALRLPATITSRCQKIVFHKPEKEMAEHWLASQHIDNSELLLKMAEGYPLKALALAKDEWMTVRQELYQGMIALTKGTLDPLLFAAKLQESNMVVLFTLLQSWMRDMLRIQLIKDVDIINSDYEDAMHDIAQTLSLENSVKYLDLIQSLNEKILSRFNLNKQLLLEQVGVYWKRYVSC